MRMGGRPSERSRPTPAQPVTKASHSCDASRSGAFRDDLLHDPFGEVFFPGHRGLLGHDFDVRPAALALDGYGDFAVRRRALDLPLLHRAVLFRLGLVLGDTERAERFPSGSLSALDAGLDRGLDSP